MPGEWGSGDFAVHLFPDSVFDALHDINDLSFCQSCICADSYEIIDVRRFFPVDKRRVETVVGFGASRDIVSGGACQFSV